MGNPGTQNTKSPARKTEWKERFWSGRYRNMRRNQRMREERDWR